MKTSRLGVLTVALPLLGLGFVAARADDDAPKKKEKKEEEIPESPLESADARQAIDKVGARLKAKAWNEAFGLAREALEKHGEALVRWQKPLADPKPRWTLLHLPARSVLRRRLAALPKEGLAAFAEAFGEEAQRRLAEVSGLAEPTGLLEHADRFFPLEEGGIAANLAADRALERGSVLLAAWESREVFERHPSTTQRLAAARRLVGLLPVMGDRESALDLADALAASELPGREALEVQARAAAKVLAPLAPQDCSVTAAGALAPIATCALTKAREWKTELPEIPAGFNWREPVPANTQPQWNTPPAGIRRLLSGHAATARYVIAHLGDGLLAYHAEDDEARGIKGGQEAWDYGKAHNAKTFFSTLLTAPALARYGMVVARARVLVGDDATSKTFETKGCIFATVRAKSVKSNELMPRGHLVAVDVETGEEIWDSLDGEKAPDEGRPKKKKDDAEAKETRLSFVGTPVVAGDRIFCGGSLAGSPEQTLVFAVDTATGKLLWQRPLMTSTPFAVGAQPWERLLPKSTPAPAIALVHGGLLALSNNGCVSALDGRDGRVLWSRTYDRDEVPANARGMMWQQNPELVKIAVGRGYNPILPCGDGGLLFPSDSPSVYLVRASDGAELASKGRQEHRHVLGAQNGFVFLTGEKGVAAYAVKSSTRVEDGEVVRSLAFSTQWGQGDSSVFKETGRGVLVSGWVVVPTEKGIDAFPVDTGEGKVPLVRWNTKQAAGDLVLGKDRIFSVGATRVSAFVEAE